MYNYKWRPCSEGQPDIDGVYLVTVLFHKVKFVCIRSYGIPKYSNVRTKKRCWYNYDSEYGDYVCDDIIAWMPLPRPFSGIETNIKDVDPVTP